MPEIKGEIQYNLFASTYNNFIISPVLYLLFAEKDILRIFSYSAIATELFKLYPSLDYIIKY